MICEHNLMYIDGQWVPATDGATMAVVDPATEAEIDRVPMAVMADVDRAIDAAAEGLARWQSHDVWARTRILRRVADGLREAAEEIGAILTAEQGKPLAQARGEVVAAADQFDWYADEARRIYGRVVTPQAADHRILVLREPIGVTVAFTPWNFPAVLPARKIAPAMAAGCSVILKPAEETPRTAFALAAACAEAGVPPGVVNVVTGDPAMVTSRLIASATVRKVSFTGSVPIGVEVLRQASAGVKAVSMELGGHAPVLVFPDVDVDTTALACVQGKFRNAGQVCTAASRFFVHESIARRFEEAFVDATRELRLGPGTDTTADMGPLANGRRVDAVDRLVSEAADKGARVVTGGRRPAAFDRGYWYEPTVLTAVDPSMAVLSSEPFGPIAPIAPFRDVAEATRLANDSPYGLAAYVFTRDLSTAFTVSEGLDVGMVGVNELAIGVTEAPFGGVKQSGYGRESGAEGIEGYLRVKTLNVKLDGTGASFDTRSEA